MCIHTRRVDNIIVDVNTHTHTHKHTHPKTYTHIHIQTYTLTTQITEVLQQCSLVNENMMRCKQVVRGRNV